MILCQESRHNEKKDFSACKTSALHGASVGMIFRDKAMFDKATSRGESAYHAHHSM
jgi:hypothetical protein